MKVTVIEVRSEVRYGATERDAPLLRPEIEVEVSEIEDEPGRRIILHPGESVEYYGGRAFVQRAHGTWHLDDAPIR